jgi:hypothetical protein
MSPEEIRQRSIYYARKSLIDQSQRWWIQDTFNSVYLFMKPATQSIEAITRAFKSWNWKFYTKEIVKTWLMLNWTLAVFNNLVNKEA